MIRLLRSNLLKWTLCCMAAFAGGATVALVIVWHAVPVPLERLQRWPSSPQITDIHGRMLLEVVGADDHWRRPVPLERMSPWVQQALIAVEDERFVRHGGVDFLAACRAAVSNIRARRVVSGASTLTMQIGRMIDDCHGSVRAKAQQCLRAWQLEQRYSKSELLELYLNIAPFGGNIRGIEAAAWYYFNKSAADLSLSESALLAGLPQSPSRLRPDRHPKQARRRRRKVLARMVDQGMISSDSARRAELEAVCAARPRRRAPRAHHAAWMGLALRPRGGGMTLDLDVQREIEHLVHAHRQRLPRGTDIAVVVINIERSALSALIGSCDYGRSASGQVNGALATRSSGSTLKPFIYALAFEQRRLAADSIVYDVPISRGGWQPRNFDGTWRGAVTVREALQDSLNIPAILTVEALGPRRCVGLLQAVGLKIAAHSSTHSGLALAVGGLEVRLLDLTQAYATLGRGGLHAELRYFADQPLTPPQRVLEERVCLALDDMLSSHARTPVGLDSAAVDSRPWFAWKTGTSSGRRDAWAVGHNGVWAIGVWVGRFGGGGSPDFVGAGAAEPLLVRCFSHPSLCRKAAKPPAAEPWTVTRPLPPPMEVAGPLNILEPHDDARFLAVDGSAHVSVRLNHTDAVHWFLNGRRIDPPLAGGLELPLGRHTLRCIRSGGESAAVRFNVDDALN